MRLAVLFAATLTLLGYTTHALADRAYVTIEGTKQGKFKGQGGDGPQKDKNEAVALEWATTVSSAPPTLKVGAPLATTPRKSLQPLTLTFHLNPFTPQLFQAAATNETLKSVLYEVFEPTPEGETEITNTIRLSNARVLSVRLFDKNGLDDTIDHLVEVSFDYQKIEIENKPAKVMASDGVLTP